MFRQLDEALAADPLLRIVVAMREEYVAQIDPYVPMLTQGPHTRFHQFHLESLRYPEALLAVTGPLRGSETAFAPGVAEQLVTDLLTVQVEAGPGGAREVVGEFVEPVQLQVVCRQLWSLLPLDTTPIDAEHVAALGGIDQVLGHYYDNAVEAA